jgi:hypothetical protein
MNRLVKFYFYTFVLFTWILSPRLSLAAKFSNQFAEFELPAQWQCSLEGAEWVCQNTNESKKKEAIIVLAAKLKGDQDSLDQYLNFLKGTRIFTSPQGKPIKSNPKYAKTVDINGQAWVDALHLESEIPGFYTRYLATVKQDIGILLTYSINRAKYQDYINDFETLAKTLKVYRKSGGINAAPQNASLFQNPQIPVGAGNETVFSGSVGQIQGGADQLSSSDLTKKNSALYFQGLIFAALVVAAFVLITRKRK